MFSRLFTGQLAAVVAGLQLELQTLRRVVDELSTKVSTGSTTALLVRINELEQTLEALQKSNRREFGKLWRAQKDDDDDGASDAQLPGESPDAIRARLRAQLPTPRIGARPNGAASEEGND